MSRKFSMQGRKQVTLILGQEYWVGWYNGKVTLCKFIKPTPCGYNFLNINTNTCSILKHHLYMSKHPDYKNRFIVNSNLVIKRNEDK